MRVPLLILLHVSPLLVSAAPKACDQSTLSPFRRFTNAIISSIWPLKYGQATGTANANCPKSRDGPKPANLYSEDIVLRFNLSSAAQARAIAEAAEEFYLDIWEHSDDWVDIRVAQSFVCFITTTQIPSSK
jgi:extracellular matrix protein 14